MIIDVTVPKWGLTMKDAQITKWLKNEGDLVEKDEPIAEAASEKITNVINSPVKGKVVKILVQEGETVPVGTVVAQIESE